MVYTASGKNSFKQPVEDDILLYYDTLQILALIQKPVPINCFFGIKKQEFEERSLQMSTWKYRFQVQF